MSHLQNARAAIKAIETCEAEARQMRQERDAAIFRLHEDDGLSAPAIAKSLGMSISNVRVAIRLGKAAHDRALADARP